MDARVDSMVYASIEYPPVLGGKVKSCDDKEALKVAGVLQTIPIDPFKPPPAFQPLGGVAVIADNTWAAFQGRQKLKIDWANGPNQNYDSGEYKKELQATAHTPGKVVRNEGDVDPAFAHGGKIVEADHYVPLPAHVPMEPMVALAEFKDDKVTAWAPTQNPQGVREIMCRILRALILCRVREAQFYFPCMARIPSVLSATQKLAYTFAATPALLPTVYRRIFNCNPKL